MSICKLHNQIKHYRWGSPRFIPNLMGLEGDGEPWAEMWMGGGELPFLFKLLAAEKPLSIQAHPNLAQAREGFERENREGLPLDAPNRNYKDANHKPEIICALTPFTGMCGFREIGEIHELMAKYLTQRHRINANNLKDFLNALFGFNQETRNELTEFILSSPDMEGEEWRLMREFAQAYPGDPAVIAPLYLNIFHLEPGEALFLEAGVLHAYIHGFGVELMANSDNVLRGGLTPKHIDIPELLKVLNFTPYRPNIIKPNLQPPGLFIYPTPCKDFSLSVMHGNGGEETFAPHSPSICIVTRGEVTINGALLKQGESAFLPPDHDPLVLRGHYTLYIASGGQ